jgi:hypothetical protein
MESELVLNRAHRFQFFFKYAKIETAGFKNKNNRAQNHTWRTFKFFFKESKLELEVLLKEKKCTTLVHTTYISGSNNLLPAFCSHLWLHFVPCMHFASNRLKWKPREMGILLPKNRHYRRTLLATFGPCWFHCPANIIHSWCCLASQQLPQAN